MDQSSLSTPYDNATQDYLVEYAHKNNLLISYVTDYYGCGSSDPKYFEVAELPDWIDVCFVDVNNTRKQYSHNIHPYNQNPLNHFYAHENCESVY